MTATSAQGEAAAATRWRVPWPMWLALAGFLAAATGFALDRTWQALPRELRLFELLVIAALAMAPALVLRRWPRWRVAATLAVIAVAGVGVFGGWLPVLAVLLLALAAIGAGSLVADGVLALVAGLAMITGLTGWLLPLGIHTRWSHLLALAVLVVLRRHAILATLRSGAARFTAAIDAAPVAAAGAMLALLLASTGCWLPTMQYDDVAYHLGLPWQLQETARYALDPDQQVWALAPWAGDVLQAIAQLVAGQEARGAMNALWLGIAAASAFALARLAAARPWACWAAVGVFASLPLTMSLAAGMQTELPAVAVTLAFSCVAWNGTGSPLRSAAGGGVLFGLLCGLKMMHAMTALPLLAWVAVRHRHAIGARTLLVAGGAALAVGGASYAYAWLVAGNPVLPLFNAVFESPYFRATNFLDARWAQGASPALPWRMTFDTAGFMEGLDGALGFAWVALSGAWLLAVLDQRTRGIALAGGAALVLAVLPIQYARYAYPSLVLFAVPAVAALDRALPGRLAAALVLALCVVQLGFFGSGYWHLGSGAVRQAVVAGGADTPLFEAFAPERALLARMRAAPSPPTGHVLVLGAEPDALAELGTRGRTISWYSHRLSGPAAKANRDASGRAWAALVRREQVTDLVLRPQRLTPAQRAALGQLRARKVAAVGEAEWWRVP